MNPVLPDDAYHFLKNSAIWAVDTVLYQCVGLFCIFVVIEVKVILLAIFLLEVPLLRIMLSFRFFLFFFFSAGDRT